MSKQKKKSVTEQKKKQMLKDGYPPVARETLTRPNMHQSDKKGNGKRRDENKSTNPGPALPNAHGSGNL